MYIIEPHTNYKIVDASGALVLNKRMPLGMQPESGDNGYGEPAIQYNGLRWTMDPDFLTAHIEWDQSPNPFVVQISTDKYVALDDNPANIPGLTDLYFYTETGAAPGGLRARPADSRTPAAGAGTFDIRGRALRVPSRAARGTTVAIRPGATITIH